MILRRQLGGLELGRLIDTAIAGRSPPRPCSPGSATWSGTASTRRSAASTIAQIVSLGVALLAGFATYVGAVLALRVPEAGQIIRLVRRI